MVTNLNPDTIIKKYMFGSVTEEENQFLQKMLFLQWKCHFYQLLCILQKPVFSSSSTLLWISPNFYFIWVLIQTKSINFHQFHIGKGLRLQQKFLISLHCWRENIQLLITDRCICGKATVKHVKLSSCFFKINKILKPFLICHLWTVISYCMTKKTENEPIVLAKRNHHH